MPTPSDESIIIVSGLPRSGTSMMMQILESGGVSILTDRVRQADEDNPKGYYEFEPVKRTKQDPFWVSSAGGMGVKMVYRLLYDLPMDFAYRVIFMKRPLNEVIASQRAMLERTGKEGAALGDEKLAEIYRRELDRVDSWMTDQESVSVLYVDYHDVLQDPQRQTESVNHFLGGALDSTAMAKAVEPKLYRQKR